MKTPQELKDQIERAEAVAVSPGKFRVDLVLLNGERITIKAKGNKPCAVQLYKVIVNGNARDDTEAEYFTFAVSVPSDWRGSHLKTYSVS